ncbi:MAG TPA: hypothetical protein VJ044_15015 [Candidatus Hodarchaeales archaeon]|nr:hypothetical protein [Candidatus Hodarchaeales archaeon]
MSPRTHEEIQRINGRLRILEAQVEFLKSKLSEEDQADFFLTNWDKKEDQDDNG